MNKSNAQHAILFEAISLILALDFSKDLLNSSVSSLGRFLSVKVGSNSFGVLVRPCQCKQPVLNAGTGHNWTFIITCCVLASCRSPTSATLLWRTSHAWPLCQRCWRAYASTRCVQQSIIASLASFGPVVQAARHIVPRHS